MTKQQISEIFALFKINFQSAPIFKGEPEEIRQNINSAVSLWERSLNDVDPWIGLSAAEYIVQHNKYFPNIAEFTEAVSNVQGMIDGEIGEAFSTAKMWIGFAEFGIKPIEKAIESLPMRTRRVLNAIGGIENFTSNGKYNYVDFYSTYLKMLKTNRTFVTRPDVKVLKEGVKLIET